MVLFLERIVADILNDENIGQMTKNQKDLAEEILSEAFKTLINEYNKDDTKTQKKQEMIEIFD